MKKINNKNKEVDETQSTENVCPADAEAEKNVEADIDVAKSLTLKEIQELIKKAEKAEEWKNKYLYATAELDNFRKRSAKERSDLIKYSGKNILYDLLEVIDNFDRAIEADKKESDPKIIVQGIEIVYKQLLKVLDSYSVKSIESKEKNFDPEIHEAIQKIHTDEAKPGAIIGELQKGYFHKDKILRPARVVVAAEPETED